MATRNIHTIALQKCQICNQPGGANMQCAKGKCCRAFHPICARESGVTINETPFEDGSVLYEGFCYQHDPVGLGWAPLAIVELCWHPCGHVCLKHGSLINSLARGGETVGAKGERAEADCGSTTAGSAGLGKVEGGVVLRR
ncbi:hypothetical protein BC936DRAFT_146992 [Jimgerdemannia flammicorona]|uniref:Zinc finger PHD-type domain-containing protein n=1 Tax=Jimgerdemannia flammicorona TaxID=994334 RepID=A0A433D6B9_9FUNG|nr:hypothetical protein BC936DRAFT_146992 [Jimgerdemannia flammicorona]